MKHLMLSSVFLALILAACSPATAATPTGEPPDIDATVGAMSQTMVAETLASIPTNMPNPTETPFPTPTASLTPTVTPTITSTPVPLPWSCEPDGRLLAMMEFRNNSGQEVYAVLSSDICYREFAIDPGASVTMSVPIYTYTYYGYIGSDHSFAGVVNLSDPIHTWVLYISDTDAVLENP